MLKLTRTRSSLLESNAKSETVLNKYEDRHDEICCCGESLHAERCILKLTPFERTLSFPTETELAKSQWQTNSSNCLAAYPP